MIQTLETAFQVSNWVLTGPDPIRNNIPQSSIVSKFYSIMNSLFPGMQE